MLLNSSFVGFNFDLALVPLCGFLGSISVADHLKLDLSQKIVDLELLYCSIGRFCGNAARFAAEHKCCRGLPS